MIEFKSRGVHNKPAQPSAPLRRQHQGIALAVALCVALPPIATRAQVQGAGALRIEVTGFDDGSGHAIAKLFLPGQNVRQRGHLEAKADIRDGKAVLVFPAVLPGDFAVVVFHDSNDNGGLDHNLMGMPKEQLGFSGAFTMTLTSGLPTFDKLKIAHGPSDQVIAIRLEGL